MIDAILIRFFVGNSVVLGDNQNYTSLDLAPNLHGFSADDPQVADIRGGGEQQGDFWWG
jgi:hypothetical protein